MEEFASSWNVFPSCMENPYMRSVDLSNSIVLPYGVEVWEYQMKVN